MIAGAACFSKIGRSHGSAEGRNEIAFGMELYKNI
jgi:hypothetical protein